LVVDDSGFNIFTAKGLIIKDYFAVVDEAGNGEKALEMVKLCPRDNFYELILMDCNMPVMSGLEASKHLNQMIKDGVIPYVKIVGLSAHNEDFRDSCIQSGMNDYITKPITMEKVKTALSGTSIMSKH
jgi:CheY-like chemotaxis protein